MDESHVSDSEEDYGTVEANSGERHDRFTTQFEMFNHVFRSIRHVEKVTLSHWCIEMLVQLKTKYMVMPLSNSKILELYYVNAKDILDLVEMMFPKLERLIVDQGDQGFDGTYGEEVHIAMVDACNSLASAKMTFPSPSLLRLKTFEATWSISKPSIIPVIQVLLESAPVLEKMVLRLRQDASYPKTFILAQEKVLSMPRSSPTAQVIITDDFGITDKSSSTCSCSSCNY
ncbi:uncharacterized protein LOC130991705 isoform X2 [Salvia miltiorrhiza]|uniref:uncharacterized protein LOC130991705 isoform X2 n=1 Tax=Salvia miltiorrhiza TaxID=226208 RepID=UPI0025AD392E|nr:uncharacterized protein LOC130991705 isoform X2 [Salvia miltiorrhiza]